MNNRTELMIRLEEDVSSGLSRREIAKKARVSEGTIRSALDGKNLDHDVLLRLAKHYFKVPPDEMYRMAGILPPRTSLMLSYEEEEIFRDLEALRDSREYPAVIIALKALLDVAKTKADSPDPGG